MATIGPHFSITQEFPTSAAAQIVWTAMLASPTVVMPSAEFNGGGSGVSSSVQDAKNIAVSMQMPGRINAPERIAIIVNPTAFSAQTSGLAVATVFPCPGV